MFSSTYSLKNSEQKDHLTTNMKLMIKSIYLMHFMPTFRLFECVICGAILIIFLLPIESLENPRYICTLLARLLSEHTHFNTELALQFVASAGPLNEFTQVSPPITVVLCYHKVGIFAAVQENYIYQPDNGTIKTFPDKHKFTSRENTKHTDNWGTAEPPRRTTNPTRLNSQWLNGTCEVCGGLQLIERQFGSFGRVQLERPN